MNSYSLRAGLSHAAVLAVLLSLVAHSALAATLTLRPFPPGNWPIVPWDGATVITVVSNRAYAGGERGLQIFDVSVPATPARVGVYRTGSPVGGVRIAGPYAYLGSGTAGLQIINVTNPAKPFRVGACAMSGNARAVEVSGSYAYVGAWPAGLQIIDVSDPAAPLRVGGYITNFANQYNTNGEVLEVQVVNNIAYLATGTGLHIVDVSDPANPVRLSRIGDSASALQISGNYAYVPGRWEEPYVGRRAFGIIDISKPSSPAYVGGGEYYADAMYFHSIKVAGNYAYLMADPYSQMDVYAITNPRQSFRIAAWPAYNEPLAGLCVADHYAYVTDPYVGLRVIDISNPAQPFLVGRHGQARDVQVDGDYAYLADSGGIHVIDVSHPEAPIRLSSREGFPDRLQIRGDLLYVTGWFKSAEPYGDGLHIFDVSSRSNIVELGHYADGYSVSLQSNYVYLAVDAEGADGYGLYVVDVSDPRAPVRVGRCPTTWYAYGVFAAGRYAYVRFENEDDEGGLSMVDISDPTRPFEVGAHWFATAAPNLDVNGTRLYVANGEFGLEIMDVSTPTNWVLVGHADTHGAAYEVHVAGKFAYITVRPRGMEVVDVSDPAHPTWLAEVSTGEGPGPVRVVDGLIYLANGYQGLAIFPSIPRVQFSLEVDGTGDGPFTIETAENVAAPADWKPLLTTNAIGGAIRVTDQNLQGVTQKFYRVQYEP